MANLELERSAQQSDHADENRADGPGAPFVSAARNFEDVMLWRALSGIGKGFYIDVGAGDPDAGSVTRAFYENGWHGINVEPVAETWRRICESRPRDISLCVAAGNAVGHRPIFLIDGGRGLSTLCEDIARAHANDGRPSVRADCPVTTLQTICEDHVAGPVHFLKIVAGGMERQVLEGADFRRHRPWIVVVEARHPNSRAETQAEWEDLLISADYRLAYLDGLNRFYIASERWERLGPALALPPNVFDNFIRSGEADAFARAAESEARGTEAARLSAMAELRAVEAERRAEEATRRATEAEQARSESDAKAAAALDALRRAQAERDAYEQEMFEIGRHAARVSMERQNLIWQASRREAELQQSQRELQQRQRELDHHRLWIGSLYASTSWKVARPVRAVRKLLKLLGPGR